MLELACIMLIRDRCRQCTIYLMLFIPFRWIQRSLLFTLPRSKLMNHWSRDFHILLMGMVGINCEVDSKHTMVSTKMKACAMLVAMPGGWISVQSQRRRRLERGDRGSSKTGKRSLTGSGRRQLDSD